MLSTPASLKKKANFFPPRNSNFFSWKSHFSFLTILTVFWQYSCNSDFVSPNSDSISWNSDFIFPNSDFTSCKRDFISHKSDFFPHNSDFISHYSELLSSEWDIISRNSDPPRHTHTQIWLLLVNQPASSPLHHVSHNALHYENASGSNHKGTHILAELLPTVRSSYRKNHMALSFNSWPPIPGANSV